jgi:hypothetical protein
MGTFAQVSWKKPLIYAGRRISRGELPASEGRYYLPGEEFVSQVLYFKISFSFIVPATRPRENEGEDEVEEPPDFWQGNRNRKLWKASCTRAALNVR